MESPIAIVGIGGIFPGAQTLDQFWQNVRSGRDASRIVPPGRWCVDPETVYDADGVKPDKVYSKTGCFIEDFDLNCSGLSIETARIRQLDLMHHFVLHAGRGAFDDAKMTGVDRQRIGVILGNIALPTATSSALAREILGTSLRELSPDLPAEDTFGTTAAINRYVTGLPGGILAEALGLGGGSYTLDAACASSLYALKLAVDELQSGRADAMLTGGVSRADSLYTQMGFTQLHALSARGKCAPFDALGDGLVVGEGAGIVVIKRLEDAVRDGDHVYAVIRGIGLSNDIEGNLLAPSSEGQLRAMRPVYERTGIDPQSVQLVECHATGTPLGDKVEFDSLNALWGDARPRDEKCVIGSVKSNVGHLLTGAGAAGLIKTLLALKHETLPPTANFNRPHDRLDFAGSPFEVLGSARGWSTPQDGPRRAAVNAFGFGGINAHVLIEAYTSAAVPTTKTKRKRPKTKAGAPAAVAIVGMDAAFGQWIGLRAFQERVLGSSVRIEPAFNRGWWGATSQDWFRAAGYDTDGIKGFYIRNARVPLGKYRIPPNELKAMLPQQLVMLQVAAGALEDADYDSAQGLRTGVFIGIGLDLATTNFHFRWSLQNDVDAVRSRRDAGATPTAFSEWLSALRDAAGPALTADRTMGALGGIVASRIAREFRVGGPSHTVSGEENSGIRALEVALRALQSGEIDRAMVGAVDLNGDIRSILNTDADRPFSRSGRTCPFDTNADGTVPGEGAAAVVLRRLDDVIRDGDRIYAVIRGVGGASGYDTNGITPATATCGRAMARAYRDAAVDPASIQLVEANGSGFAAEDHVESDAMIDVFEGCESSRFLGSAKADIGHSGAASGLASVVKTALCLYQEIVPGIRNSEAFPSTLRDAGFIPVRAPQYWLRNRADGPRRAAVNVLGIDGNCTHLVLEGYDDNPPADIDSDRRRPLGNWNEALFAIEGVDSADVRARIAALATMREADTTRSIESLAAMWWHTHGHTGTTPVGLALLARDHGELKRLLTRADQAVRDGAAQCGVQNRIFFNPDPMGNTGDLAFVFPGSGNHFHGMGRELSISWPGIFRAHDRESLYLRDQFVPDHFWDGGAARKPAYDYKAMISGQVFLGALTTEIMHSLGIRADAIIGYSLGESTGLVALGVWSDRDEVVRRMNASTLFSRDLVGECRAVRDTWSVPADVEIRWAVGVLDCPAAQVIDLLQSRSRVYLLIVNTPGECVIGGDEEEVEELVNQLNCRFHPIFGAPTVHCEVARVVEDRYRDLHLLETTPPPDTRFYSMAWQKAYDVTSNNAAETIVSQAMNRMDFPAVIERAYADGVRYFIEMGPGASCSRMISIILGERPHLAGSVCFYGQDSVVSVLRMLGQLIADRYPVDLGHIYDTIANGEEMQAAADIRFVSVPTDAPGFDVPKAPLPLQIEPVVKSPARPTSAPAVAAAALSPAVAESSSPAAGYAPLIREIAAADTANVRAHSQYLQFSNEVSKSMSNTLAFQMQLLESMIGSDEPVPSIGIITEAAVADVTAETTPASAGGSPAAPYRATVTPASPPVPQQPASAPASRNGRKPVLDRDMCMEFAIGSIAKVLGPEFAPIDAHPTRVRLPDEPLMLVDRILEIDGTPRSMGSGRVVTEHDVLHDGWYLDNGRIPTCVAVEAGQADLFLSGYLGIDFETKGLAVYRLLDADVIFHDALPQPGAVIHYDIRIDHFFRQGETYLFRFNFDSTVAGQPLMTMRNGCAGFFTEAALAAGKGIVHTKMQLQPMPGKRPDDWRELVPMCVESYDDDQIAALRQGDFVQCFGPAFAAIDVSDPLILPSGRMKLVDRVLNLDPAGGRFGLGSIRAQADIHPDDWFLTCHFVDDRVMPGTLMYECCLHTLRIFLMRMGWIVDKKDTVFEPVIGIRSRLKCRGQVLETTKHADYEITLKEIGYDPEPYVLADALMYSDDKQIVEIIDMSVRLSGMTRQKIERMWLTENETITAPLSRRKPAIYTNEQILAFAIGKPSEAFGDRYRVFDEERLIARLPGPPYKFLDRITEVNAEAWVLKAGGSVEGQYDVPPDEWYFAENRQGMPFAVLLEIALQPCGWFAAYLGSALTNDVDMHFRNLGGDAVQTRLVTPATGILTINIDITSVANSGGMIIQHFNFNVSDAAGTLYKGITNFGFFTREALANQLGVRDAAVYAPTAAERTCTPAFDYPTKAPYPGDMMRMLDRITVFDPSGGPHGCGVIQGTKAVDRKDWFFDAHFYQDPVCPGSLGLESFLQLLKVVAVRRWNLGPSAQLETVTLNRKHSWIYRGQVVPSNQLVTVDAVITQIDEENRMITADGYLSVDGLVIYQMTNFTLRVLD